MHVGGGELLLILLVILLLFGGPRLPDLARSLGNALAAFNKEAKRDEEGREGTEGAAPVPDGQGAEVPAGAQLSGLRVLRLISHRISVFVCSVMDELQDERRAVADAIEAMLLVRPWLFEDHGGPQRADVQDVCLDAVRECEIFLALVGGRISRIVLDEYETALAFPKPVLVYVQKGVPRSAEAEQWLAKVGRDGITWAEFRTVKDLQARVQAGLINEIVKGYARFGLSEAQLALIIPLAGLYEKLAESYAHLDELDGVLAGQPTLSEPYHHAVTRRDSILKEIENAEKRLANDLKKAAEKKFFRSEPSREPQRKADKGSQALWNDGLAHNAEGRHREALNDFQAYVKANPKDPEGWVEVARSCNLLKDFQGAVRAATKAIELDPHRFDGLNRRGLAYLNLGSYDKAIADLRRSITLDRENRESDFANDVLRQAQSAQARLNRQLAADKWRERMMKRRRKKK